MSNYNKALNADGTLGEIIGRDVRGCLEKIAALDARLSALEAAQKKLELQPVSIRDVLSHEPKGRFELRFDGTIGWRKDAPDKPREPGLYSVDWGENSQDWPLAFHSDGTWYKIYFTTIGAATPRVIGPRIPEPGE